MKKIFSIIGLIFLLSTPLFAAQMTTRSSNDCITASSIIPPSGTWYWSTKVVITNQCDHAVELKDAVYSIETPFLPSEVAMSFATSGMSWAGTQVLSQVKGSTVPNYPSLDYYTTTLSLLYGSDSWLVTSIKPQGSLQLTLAANLPEAITFTDAFAEHMQKSFKVFSSTTPPETAKGSITINLDAAPVQETDFPKQASFVISGPNNYQQQIEMNWGTSSTLSDLTLGTYTVHSISIDYNHAVYQADMPDAVSLSDSLPDQTIHAKYVKNTTNVGHINLHLGPSPAEGLNPPEITVRDVTANSDRLFVPQWGQSIAIENAVADHQYQINAQAIDGYTRTAQPSSFILGQGSTVEVLVQYQSIDPLPAMGTVSLTLNGLPVDHSAAITFVNSKNHETVSLNFMNGEHVVSLAEGIYTVDAAVSGDYIGTMVTGTNPITVSESTPVSIAFQYNKKDPSEITDKHIVAYFTAWGIYGRNYQVTDIPALKVTDINYAFLNILNGECVLGDPWADIDKRYPEVTTSLGVFPEDSWNTPQSEYFGNFNRLNTMKKLAAEKGHPINLFMSVGGWTWSKYFSDVAQTSASREKFVNSCLALMNKYQFDGIDLDWEYPVSGGLSDNIYRPEDKQNYTLLLQLFREKMGQNKLLTIAAPAGPSIIPNLEWDKLANYVDWVNLMSYDFHGGWENQTGHNSALYPNPIDPAPSTLNTDSAITRITSLGYPINKLVMGVGFYGRGWQDVPSTHNGLFQSGTVTTFGTWENGVFDYHDLVNNYYPTYLRLRDKYAKVPYLYNESKGVFISYEDPESMRVKANYILNHDMAGVMFWELSGDIRNSDSLDSLLNLLHMTLKG